MTTVLITAPSLEKEKNISGISQIVSNLFTIHDVEWCHLKLGSSDEKKGFVLKLLLYVVQIVNVVFKILMQKECIVHVNTALDKFSILRDLFICIVVKISRNHLVVHVHGGRFSESISDRFIYKTFFDLMVSLSDICILLSLREIELFGLNKYAEKIRILPNFISEDLTSFQFSTKTVEVLFLGRIEAEKGIFEALEAIKLVADKGYKIKFNVCGDGRDVLAAKDYVVEHGLEKVVSFLGIVQGTKKVRMLKESNVFILLSRFEGMPVSLLESMSYGCIPVVTDVGAMSDVICAGDDGFVINKYETSSAADILIKLINDDEYRNNMARAAALKIESKYTISSTSPKLLEIYTSIIS